MRKRSDWFLSPSQKNSECDRPADTSQDHSWSSENSAAAVYACNEALQSTPLDSSAGLPLPQLCINDVCASENNSLGPTSGLGVDVYSLQSVRLDKNILSRSVEDHSPSSAIVEGSSAERLSFVLSTSSAMSDDHSPLSSTGIIQRRTIENNVFSSVDDDRHLLTLEMLDTVGEDSVVDHSSLLGQSTDSDDKILPSTMDLCRPNSTNDGADHSPQLEAHYFVVDRFYGSKSVGKTNGGNF